MIKEFWLITNYSCNNRCKWCYTESKGFVNEIMPVEYAKEVLEEMYRVGANKCTIIGGEPTVYPHLFELIEYGSKLGLYMKIVTNGILIKDKDYLTKLKHLGLSFAAISIHGSSRETYKNITMTDNFDNVISAIMNLTNIGLDFTTLTTINRLNKENIFNIAKLLNGLGVNNCIFNIAVPAKPYKDVENLVLNPQEIVEVITENYTKLRDEGIKAGFYASVPLCLFENKILNQMLNEGYLIPLSKGGCNIYDSSGFAFDPWGNLIPCCKKVNDNLLYTKNENNRFKYYGKFEKVWEEIKHYFGKESWRTPSNRCNTCKYKLDCIGGCPLFWEYFKPECFL